MRSLPQNTTIDARGDATPFTPSTHKALDLDDVVEHIALWHRMLNRLDIFCLLFVFGLLLHGSMSVGCTNEAFMPVHDGTTEMSLVVPGDLQLLYRDGHATPTPLHSHSLTTSPTSKSSVSAVGFSRSSSLERRSRFDNLRFTLDVCGWRILSLAVHQRQGV